MTSTKISMIHELIMDHQYYQPDHVHPNMEIVLYLKGKGSIKIGDKIHEFHDNCVSVINPKTVHDERHERPFNVIFLAFFFENFEIPSGVYTPKNFPILERIAKQILNEVKSPKYAYNMLVSAKIEELMVLLVRDILSSEFDQNIHDCMIYLTENCHKDIDIQKLANNYSMGYETFRHKFKKLYGMPPKNFIISKRIFKAQDMLVKSNLSCTEIAYECGFSDSAQFSKLFKRQFGISPHQFRDRYNY